MNSIKQLMTFSFLAIGIFTFATDCNEFQSHFELEGKEVGTKLSKFFGRDTNIGYITGAGVRMRGDKNTQSKIVRNLSFGDEVKFLQESDKPETIGKVQAKWYKVKTEKVEGWVFGGFLEFVKSESDLVRLSVTIRKKLKDKIDPTIAMNSANKYRKLYESENEQVWKIYYKYMELNSLDSALQNTDIELHNQSSNSFLVWLKHYNQSKYIYYNEPAGINIVDFYKFQDLSSDHPKHPLVEEFRYSAATCMVGGECEGYVPCYMARFLVTNLEYLTHHPNGKYSDEFMNNIYESFKALDDNYTYPDKNDTSEYRDYEEYLETLKKIEVIIKKVNHTKKGNILNKIEELKKK